MQAVPTCERDKRVSTRVRSRVCGEPSITFPRKKDRKFETSQNSRPGFCVNQRQQGPSRQKLFSFSRKLGQRSCARHRLPITELREVALQQGRGVIRTGKQCEVAADKEISSHRYQSKMVLDTLGKVLLTGMVVLVPSSFVVAYISHGYYDESFLGDGTAHGSWRRYKRKAALDDPYATAAKSSQIAARQGKL
eukprot:g60613.t1